MKTWMRKKKSSQRAAYHTHRLSASGKAAVSPESQEAMEYNPAWRPIIRWGVLGMVVVGAIYLMTVSLNILVLGTDDVDYSKHTDTIILLHWQPLPRNFSMLSIPRDTLVQLPKRGPVKINAVYAYGLALGTREYALAMTRSAIEALLGIKMHYVIHVQYSNFIQLVETLGGIPIHVEKPMHYQDQAGNLNINLEPGDQLLNGRQSLDYVRFRHDEDGDIGRMRRQQKFFRAFIGQMIRISKLPQTIKAFKTFVDQVETNFSVATALFVGLELKSVARHSWHQVILPGKPVYINGISYWRPDIPEVRRMVADLGRPLRKPKLTPVAAQATPAAEAAAQPSLAITGNAIVPVETPVDLAEEQGPEPEIKLTPATGNIRPLLGALKPQPTRTLQPTPKPIAQSHPAAIQPAGKQPMIRVLNGCGVSGVASRFTRKLMDNHIIVRVADCTNAPNFGFPNTIIKCRVKNLPWAKRIVTILGLGEDRIQMIPENVAYPTVTIVIGGDYQKIIQ